MMQSEEEPKPDVVLDVKPSVVGSPQTAELEDLHTIVPDTNKPSKGNGVKQKESPEVKERRKSIDDGCYTKDEFLEYFGKDEGSKLWEQAPKASNESSVKSEGTTSGQAKPSQTLKITGKLPEEPRLSKQEYSSENTTSSLHQRRMPAAPEGKAGNGSAWFASSEGAYSSEEKPDKRLADLQQELQRAYKELDHTRKERDALQIQVTGLHQPRIFAVAACDFVPARIDATEMGIVVPNSGSMLQVSKEDSLEIVARHITGWVHVKHTTAAACQNSEGWIPDGVLKAVGEVGRGVASRCCTPDEEELESQELKVAIGTLLKLIRREGEWWLVEADGCRGYVPVDAVREPTPEEESGMTVLGIKLRTARSRLPTGDGCDIPMAATESKEGAPSKGVNEKQTLIGGDPGQLAAPKRSAEKEKKPEPWTFGLWAYLASYYAQAQCVLLGLAGVLWYVRDEQEYPEKMEFFSTSWRHIISSSFAIAWGVGWFIFNTRSNMASSSGTLPPGTPFRATIFLVMSTPMLASGVTSLAGISTALVAGLSYMSANRREVGARPTTSRSPTKWLKDEMNEELKGVPCCSCRYWRTWWSVQVYRGERPKLVILTVWFLANIGLCGHKYYVTKTQLEDPPQETVDAITQKCWTGGFGRATDNCIVLLDAYRLWIPFAKLFGQGLNLNCALIAFPVCQHFMRKINTWAITKTGLAGYICRNLPTHKNLVFHKGLAGTIVVMAFAHTFAHYMAYTWSLTTFKRYGVSGITTTLSIWITGAIPLLCITIMFPVSREYVKQTNFEAFFYTHVVCASIFMLCLLWHGPVFYVFAAVPLCLYLVDRYFRSEVKALTSAKLLKMNWRPPVMQLVFDTPFKYYSGQYVWLCCPHLGKYERHPFTIASAPETELLCLAIKCWPGGWTERLRYFLSALCESSSGSSQGFSHTFEEVDWISGETLRGITKLADDTPVLQIDGPHAAPAMRYLEFKVIIIACAGIGLTPASSILKSLLQYKWRQFPNIRPHSIHFAWLVPCAEVPAYDWFADELASSEVAASANKAIHGDATDPGRDCEIHIFVTRAPGADKKEARGPPVGKQAELHGPLAHDLQHVTAPYTSTELLEWIQHPNTKSDKDTMADIMAKPHGERPNEAGHTLVWNGRPDWGAYFDHVEKMHSGKGIEVGVFFCGAPLIGKALKSECYKHSNSDVRFRLLKENF